MDYSTFRARRDKFLARPFGYREVAKNEIMAVDGTHFRVGNTTIELASPADFDKEMSIGRGQTRLVGSAYGTRGTTNLRNFFGQAFSNSDERIVLVGDMADKKVTRLMGTKHHLIPPQSFFDFAELFMDDNGYEPDAVESGPVGVDIAIRMRPVRPEYLSFDDKDDEFLSNGLSLHWNPVEISLNNFYERVICSNGAVRLVENKVAHINSVEPNEISDFLDLGKSNGIMRKNTGQLLEYAREAIGTQASVRELGIGVKMLNRLGVSTDDAEQIIPYGQNLARYEKAGYSTDAKTMQMATSNMSMWQLFNSMTAFATHNKAWPDDDIRRSRLMQHSMDLLFRTRDIKHYHNVYAG